MDRLGADNAMFVADWFEWDSDWADPNWRRSSEGLDGGWIDWLPCEGHRKLWLRGLC